MNRTKAFTLIELMVVVAIIALLIAIFAPTVQMAQEQANRTACGTRLKAIDNAFFLYSTYHGHKYPIGYEHEQDTTVTHPDVWTVYEPDKHDLTPEDSFVLMVHLRYLPTKTLLCPTVSDTKAGDEWDIIGIGGPYDGDRRKAVKEYIHYAYQDLDAARTGDFRKGRGNYLPSPTIVGDWPVFADRGAINYNGTYTGRGSGNHGMSPDMQNVVGAAHAVEVAYTETFDDPNVPGRYDYDETGQCMVGYSDGVLFDNIYRNSDQWPDGDYDKDDHCNDTYLLSSQYNVPDPPGY